MIKEKNFKYRNNIDFIEMTPKPKTKVLEVVSSHDASTLGYIEWSCKWRQYVFEPYREYSTIWSHGCLRELYEKICQLNKEQKER